MSLIFESKATPERHIRRFQTIAKLFGLNPANLTSNEANNKSPSARVLEIGCSNGSNIIPQAYSYKSVHFIGIDLDAEAITAAQKNVAALRLTNCEFLCQDLNTIQANQQKFDYIICHGLYSWVDPETSSKILDLCQTLLSEHGVAYISYNTTPGWTTRQKVRESLLQKIDRNLSQEEQMQQAIDLMQAVLKERGPSADYEDLLIAEEINNILSLSPALIYHELLAEHSRALAFSDFCAELKKHNLHYLLEANLRRNSTDWGQLTKSFGSEWRDRLIELEQTVDQKTNRSFRGSLIIHAELIPNLTIPDVSKYVKELQISSNLVAEEAIDLHSKEPAIFYSSTFGGQKVSTRLSKSILQQLAIAWPNSCSYLELLTLAKHSLSDLSPSETALTLQELSSFFWRGLIEIDFVGIQCAKSTGKIFSPACFEATLRTWVTNQRHEYVQLDPFESILLKRHSRASSAEIANEIKRCIASGELKLSLDGQAANNSHADSELLALLANQVLQRLVEAALIEVE